MEYFARSIEAVIRDAHVDRAILVGHSLGGPIAYAFLRLFPEKATAMVLVDVDVRPGSAGPINAAEQRARMARTAIAMQGAAGDRAFETSVESMFTLKTPEALKAEIRTKMLATPKYVRIAAVTSPSSLPPPGKDEKFDLPAIAIQATSGGTDTRFAIMKTLFPSLQLEKWDGAGHFLMMEDPDRFNASLERFLSALQITTQK
jgi:pimeloyl-ACP methyl ester carboxylesterase